MKTGPATQRVHYEDLLNEYIPFSQDHCHLCLHSLHLSDGTKEQISNGDFKHCVLLVTILLIIEEMFLEYLIMRQIQD